MIRNIKFRIYNLESIITVIFLLTILVVLPTKQSFAQTPIQETEASPTESSAEAQKIRQASETEIKEEIQSAQGEKKAFFGEINDLYNHTLILETSQGKKTAQLDEATVIVDQKKNKVPYEDLEIGSFLIAMGYEVTADKLQTKRIVITPKPEEVNRVALLGTLEKTKGTKLSFKTSRENISWQVLITNKTKFLQKTAEETREIKLGDIAENSLAIVAGISKIDNEVEAKLIYLLAVEEPSPNP